VGGSVREAFFSPRSPLFFLEEASPPPGPKVVRFYPRSRKTFLCDSAFFQLATMAPCGSSLFSTPPPFRKRLRYFFKERSPLEGQNQALSLSFFLFSLSDIRVLGRETLSFSQGRDLPYDHPWYVAYNSRHFSGSGGLPLFCDGVGPPLNTGRPVFDTEAKRERFPFLSSLFPFFHPSPCGRFLFRGDFLIGSSTLSFLGRPDFKRTHKEIFLIQISLLPRPEGRVSFRKKTIFPFSQKNAEEAEIPSAMAPFFRETSGIGQDVWQDPRSANANLSFPCGSSEDRNSLGGVFFLPTLAIALFPLSRHLPERVVPNPEI